MKKILVSLIIISTFISCVTPSHSFLANKHQVENKEIKIISESKPNFTYSPFFHAKSLLEFSEYYLTEENKDSVNQMYQKMVDGNIKKKNNCLFYDVIYTISSDTIKQRVYFIETRDYQVTHDNDILNRMFVKIEEYLKK